jgi:DNA polymerase-3 subunit delta'
VPLSGLKATEPDQQVEEVQDLLSEALTARRENPLWGEPDGMARHPLASIRLLHRLISLRPFQGDRRVIVLGRAERLVVQEASQEAANALLKVLEEPPPGSYLILTARHPQALLPTMRSRLVLLRVSGVGDEAVRRFLEIEFHPPLGREELERRVLFAQGSIGRAIWGGGIADSAARAAAEFVAAVRGGSDRWAAAALGQAPWGARGEFTQMLDALLLRLREGLVQRASKDPKSLPRLLQAIRQVEEIRAAAQGNVNPQLAFAVLASRFGALR